MDTTLKSRAPLLMCTQNIMLPGPVGQLEAMLTLPMGVVVPQVIGIVCHPHPLQEGNMHHKVVTTIAKALDQLGLATIRFNYRGVGRSEGVYGNMQGEIADLRAVKAWASTQFPDCVFWLAGFSFGGFIAASVAEGSDDVLQLITVAPAVHHADFTRLTAIHCPWLIIQGDQDEVVPAKDVVNFVRHSPLAPRLLIIEKAGHFFHGQLAAIQNGVLSLAHSL